MKHRWQLVLQPCLTPPPLQGRAYALGTVGGELPLSGCISANSSALREHCAQLGLEACIPLFDPRYPLHLTQRPVVAQALPSRAEVFERVLSLSKG